MKQEERWLRFYYYAKLYNKENGNLLVPNGYTIKDDDGKDVNLGSWIANQRKGYKRGNLSDDRIKLLEKINIQWEIRNEKNFLMKWMKNYFYAKKYYLEHGNLLVPINYEIKDSNDNTIYLGKWIIMQRRYYVTKKLNKEKIELLNSIKMVWNIRGNKDIISDTWMKKYFYAKKYYLEHGNLLIPFDYEIKDESDNIIKLGNWINTQRRAYRKEKKRVINDKQIELLNSIHMVWNVKDNKETLKCKWMNSFLLAKKYYEENNNLLIPYTYMVTDNNNNLFDLGKWIIRQRSLYEKGKLDNNQIELLNSIKMIWTKEELNMLKDSTWEKYYLVLLEYKNTYGDLFIPCNYTYTDSNTNETYYLYDFLNLQKNVLLNGNKTSDKRLKLLNNLDKDWFLSQTEKLNNYIEDSYDNYLQGKLSEEEINNLISKGALKYSDSNIVKSNIELLDNKIKKRSM